MLTFAIVNVVQLAVKQVGFAYGADLDFVGDPFGAAAGDLLLLESVGKLKPFVFYLEGFFIRLFGVQCLYKSRLTKQELERVDAIELVTQSFIGVDGEVCRYDRKMTALGHLLFQEFCDFASDPIVSDA